MSWTIVTGLFDIPTETGKKMGNRTIDFYLQYKFVLKMDQNLVMFCDPSTYPKAFAIRKTAGLLHKTMFVCMKLRDFPFWKYYDQIAKNRAKPPVYDPNDRNTPAYLIVTSGKFYMVRKAIEMNPFQTKFVAWCDFGIQHIGDGKQAQAKYLDAALAQNREKPSFNYICYLSPKVTLDVKKMYAKAEGPCGIAGSFFTGENKQMLRLCDRIDAEFIHTVTEGHGHNDEQLVSSVHARYPQDFHLSYGDYYEQIINYVSIEQNQAAVLHLFIDRALQDQNWVWAEDACKQLFEAAFVRHTINLTKDQVRLFRDCYKLVAQNMANQELLQKLDKLTTL